MREILFRARWKDTNKVVDNFSEEYIIDACNDDCFIVEQFTGILDKNGVKIFEGDILKETRLNGVEFYYKVFYKKGGLVINTHQDDFNKTTEHIFFYESIADMQNSGFIETLEIIGNIHE